MARATREAYGEELAKLVQEDPKIVVLDADLAGSTHSIKAGKVAPERFFDMGIAEADMIGTAAGLAASGYTAFASTFAMFATGRPWEQIRNSVVYPHLNVKIAGSHAGISVGEDGVSHQAIEDIAIMRSIPTMEIYCPADAAETKAVVDYVAKTTEPCYIRLGRAKVEDVYEEGNVPDITKIHVLAQGQKIAVFATGLMVKSALEAREMLLKEGIDITVVDVCAIKPADEEGIVEVLKNHDVIFTAEEHNIINGLGSMIAEVSVTHCPRFIYRIGLPDTFAESGSAAVLLHAYGLDGEGVYKAIKSRI